MKANIIGKKCAPFKLIKFEQRLTRLYTKETKLIHRSISNTRHSSIIHQTVEFRRSEWMLKSTDNQVHMRIYCWVSEIRKSWMLFRWLETIYCYFQKMRANVLLLRSENVVNYYWSASISLLLRLQELTDHVNHFS